MNMLWMSVTAILMIISCVLLILSRQFRVITLVLLTSFWLVVFGIQWSYLLSGKFNTYINTFIQPSEVHMTYGGGRPPLPLPPATALAYRYSEEAAKYYSRLSIGEVIEFYTHQVPGVKVQSRESEDKGIRLLLIYQEVTYSVLVTLTGRSASYILVKSIPSETAMPPVAAPSEE